MQWLLGIFYISGFRLKSKLIYLKNISPKFMFDHILIDIYLHRS